MLKLFFIILVSFSSVAFAQYEQQDCDIKVIRHKVSLNKVLQSIPYTHKAKRYKGTYSITNEDMVTLRTKPAKTTLNGCYVSFKLVGNKVKTRVSNMGGRWIYWNKLQKCVRRAYRKLDLADRPLVQYICR